MHTSLKLICHPSQAFQHPGRVDVELRAVILHLADVGVQRKPFAESRSAADLRIQLFANNRFPLFRVMAGWPAI